MISFSKFKLLLFGCFVMFAVTISSASGQEKAPSYIGYQDLLGLVSYVRVKLSDQVTGNCWTNSDGIAANAKLKFEQNGIEVIDYEPKYQTLNTPIVRLSLIGLRTGGLCAGHAELSVDSYLLQRYSANSTQNEFLLMAPTLLFNKSAIFTRGTNLNEQSRDFFDAGISELLLKILKSKRKEAVARLLSEDTAIGEVPPEE